MGILSYEYQGDGVVAYQTTSGPRRIEHHDMIGAKAEITIREHDTPLHTGTAVDCREWLEANT